MNRFGRIFKLIEDIRNRCRGEVGTIQTVDELEALVKDLTKELVEVERLYAIACEAAMEVCYNGDCD